MALDGKITTMGNQQADMIAKLNAIFARLNEQSAQSLSKAEKVCYKPPVHSVFTRVYRN